MVEEIKADEQLPDIIKKGKITLTTNTKIGQGMTAKIFKQKDNKKCVKVFEKQFLKPFKQECKIINIIHRSDKMKVMPQVYIIDNAAYSIEMEVGIVDLKTSNQAKIKQKKNWSEKQMLVIIKSLADYIQFLSQELSIWHTEISMQNVMIMQDSVSGEFEVKLIDFAAAVSDPGQHPKLVKSTADNFCDKQKEYQFMRLQAEGIELSNLVKMVKVMLHTSIFQFHKDPLIKNMKSDSPDYWKIIGEHMREIADFLQKWNDDQFKEITDEKLQDFYKDVRKLY